MTTIYIDQASVLFAIRCTLSNKKCMFEKYEGLLLLVLSEIYEFLREFLKCIFCDEWLNTDAISNVLVVS
jgi:hypothetical protein